jgi:hypothetical protein
MSMVVVIVLQLKAKHSVQAIVASNASNLVLRLNLLKTTLPKMSVKIIQCVLFQHVTSSAVESTCFVSSISTSRAKQQRRRVNLAVEMLCQQIGPFVEIT